MDTFTHSYSKQECPLHGAQLHIGNKIWATFRWGYPRGNGGTVTGDEQGFCTDELFTLAVVILRGGRALWRGTARSGWCDSTD